MKTPREAGVCGSQWCTKVLNVWRRVATHRRVYVGSGGAGFAEPGVGRSSDAAAPIAAIFGLYLRAGAGRGDESAIVAGAVAVMPRHLS
jgi:hypothetical protein